MTAGFAKCAALRSAVTVLAQYSENVEDFLAFLA